MKQLLALWLPLAACCLALAACKPRQERTLVVQVLNTEQRELTPLGLVRKVYDFEGHLVEHHFPYPDGGYAHVIYRSDGTVAATLEDYPSQPGALAPVRKSEAEFAEDGKTVLLGKAYRLDGSLRMVRRASPDGRWSDEDYLPSGRQAFKSQRNPDGSWEITCLRVDGTRDSVVLVRRSKVDNESSEGSEPEPKVVWIDCFDAAGTVRLCHQAFAEEGETIDPLQPLAGGAGAMNGSKEAGRLVFFYGKGSIASHYQWWRAGRTDNADGEEFTLEIVGQFKNTELVRRFFVDDLGDEVSVTKVERQEESAEFPKVSSWPEDSESGLPIETWVTGKTRSLLFDEFCELKDMSGKRLATATSQEKETVDTRLFMRPPGSLYPVLNEELAQDDVQWIGEQDSKNPCHWYHNL